MSHSQRQGSSGRTSTVLRLVVVVTCLAGLGCGPSRQTTSRHPPTGGAPRAGGMLVVATRQDIAGINDLVSNVTSFSDAVIGQMFLELFDEQADFTEHPPTFKPRLATSYEFSEDRLTLTVKLRQGVVWSDGEPVTAADVRWTWQAQTDPSVAWPYAHSKESIRDVEVVDELTVRFHFDQAYAKQLADANEGVILPQHAWSRLPFDEWPRGEPWFHENLVVDGPFRLASWKPQEEIVLTRNPSYYEPGRPRLDRVVFRIIPERSNHVTQLLRGEVDFVPRIDTGDIEKVERSENVVIYPYWHRQYTYLGWNSVRPLFADSEVRRALTLAIDRQTIIDTLRRGYARIATSPILSSVWAHADLEPWPYDPGSARSILKDRGWRPGADGVLQQGGERFAFTLVTDAASRSWRDTAAMIQEQLKQVGIEVTIQPMEFNTLVARLQARDFDAAMGAFGMDTSLDLTYGFHTDSIEDGYNFGSYSNPSVDALIEQARGQLDPNDSGPMLRQIQEILHRDQPLTFLWEPQRISAFRTTLHEARPTPVSTFQNLHEWWIEE